MGTNFTGITFDDCNVSPSDDGIINRTILPDGILSGCEISYSGSTLTMASGTLIACGRQFRHPAAQNWAVVDATTGYARLLITLDLTRSATDQTFDQVVDAVEYANDISGFPALVQQDINVAGTKYQIVACVVSLGTGGISGIINTMPTVHPASADGGTLTVTAPSGATVTVSKDGKTLTRVAGADGAVVFRGLETGTWTLSITDGTQTASKPVEIVADYATVITFFTATINVTYPPGLSCTATDGTTTLKAPDTSGTWACVVPNSGTWTVSLDNGFAEDVTVTTDGEAITLDKWYLYNSGDEHEVTTGGWIAEKLKGCVDTASEHTLTKNTDNLSLYVKARAITAGVSGGGACIRNAEPLSLRGYTTLQLNYDIIRPGANDDMYVELSIVPETWTNWKNDAVVNAQICDYKATTAYDQSVSIDLSGAGLTDGCYYVIICLYNQNWGTWNNATINLNTLALW